MVLIFCFHLEKTAAESHRLVREVYGKRAPSQDTCERWFRRFKSGDLDKKTKRKTRNMEKGPKIRRCRIASIVAYLQDLFRGKRDL